MPSPAERYAAARSRQEPAALTEFAAAYPFPLDPFQRDACRALAAGHGVLVAAPTGAGKTVVGEFAVHLALASGGKCFYTTPLKALSNQKYGDFLARYGPERVGLLTGDNSVHGDAPVVVMTTEVLRNMLYTGSAALTGLTHVVMDEVHYLADPFRGGVWEEVLIQLPTSVTVVSLSATVSNTEEFADWLVSIRGDTTVVVEEHRPVPLWQSVLVGSRLYDLFVDDEQTELNPQLLRLAQDRDRAARVDDRRPGRGGTRTRERWSVPSRPDVVTRLDAAGLLPAIVFIFSRAGCDAAVGQCLRAGLRLNEGTERAEVRRRVRERTAAMDDDDLNALGYWEWLDGLERGIAAHHAGLLPTFKEVVEELFAAGLVKVVFATETLSLGINMPARSVVLERLSKWNGETHADLTPGEYTQLTGRAGRRGIDVEGHAVVVSGPDVDPRHLAGLASTRTYPLRSSFRPSYNMAVNLVGSLGTDRARDLLQSSFGQFQADRSVVGLARQLRRTEEAMAGYRDAMSCDRGDMGQYMDLRRRLTQREAALARSRAVDQRAAAVESLGGLRPGDVIEVPAGRRRGLAVVLDPGTGDADAPRPTVLTADRQVRKLTVVDFPRPVRPLGRVRVPRSFNPRSSQARRDLAATLRNTGIEPGDRSRRPRSAAADDTELAQLRAELRAHPCHGCPDREDHARWAERWDRARRDAAALRRRVESRTGSLARMFDRVCVVLRSLGYLDGDEVTADGRRLARLYTESDLLVAECLRAGTWDGLTPAELAGCVSSVLFESRREEGTTPPRLPTAALRTAVAATAARWAQLSEVESDNGLSVLRAPDPGFVVAAYRWASGRSLREVLVDEELTPGDFVRWTRQLLDLLDQVGGVATGTVREASVQAIAAVRRGVVASSSVG